MAQDLAHAILYFNPFNQISLTRVYVLDLGGSFKFIFFKFEVFFLHKIIHNTVYVYPAAKTSPEDKNVTKYRYNTDKKGFCV